MLQNTKYEHDPRNKPASERTQVEQDYIMIGVRNEVDKLMARYSKTPDVAMQLGMALVEAARDKMARNDRNAAGVPSGHEGF